MNQKHAKIFSVLGLFERLREGQILDKRQEALRCGAGVRSI